METDSNIKALHDAFLARARAQLSLEEAITGARGAGVSWERIGRALGMSKQGAWEQFRHLEQED
jgi:biotin operon repressor